VDLRAATGAGGKENPSLAALPGRGPAWISIHLSENLDASPLLARGSRAFRPERPFQVPTAPHFAVETAEDGETGEMGEARRDRRERQEWESRRAGKTCLRLGPGRGLRPPGRPSQMKKRRAQDKSHVRSEAFGISANERAHAGTVFDDASNRPIPPAGDARLGGSVVADAVKRVRRPRTDRPS